MLWDETRNKKDNMDCIYLPFLFRVPTLVIEIKIFVYSYSDVRAIRSLSGDLIPLTDCTPADR